MLTESASARLATPMFMHPDQLKGGPRGLPAVHAADDDAEPLARGLVARARHRRDAEDRRVGDRGPRGASTARPCSRNMYLKASHQIERGKTGEVKAYAIAAAQHDPLTVKKLVNMLLDSGVEVQQARAQFVADDRVYGPGSFVVHDGAAEAGPRAMDARTHLLSRQHLHARPRGQPDPPLRHVDRHVRRVHGRAQRSRCRRPSPPTCDAHGEARARGHRHAGCAGGLRARWPTQRRVPCRAPPACAGHRRAPRERAVGRRQHPRRRLHRGQRRRRAHRDADGRHVRRAQGRP